MMKQKWLLGVVFAALACGVLAGCGEDASAPPSSPAPASSAAAPASSAGQPEESSPVSSAQEIPVTLLQAGDTATIKNWEITLDKTEIQDEISKDVGFGSFTPDEGKRYQVITLTVKNVGTQADPLLSMDVIADDLYVSEKLIFDGKYEYDSDRLLGVSNDFGSSYSIEPLATETGILVFELPDEVINSDKPLNLQFTFEDEKVEFQIR